MNAFIRIGTLLVLVAGCGSAGLNGEADGGGSDGGVDAAMTDGALPSCSVTSPSGYACDPWSTHLYLLESIKRHGSQVRLLLVHNPEYEGHLEDQTIPLEHDYSQLLTVEVELTDAVRE